MTAMQSTHNGQNIEFNSLGKPNATSASENYCSLAIKFFWYFYHEGVYGTTSHSKDQPRGYETCNDHCGGNDRCGWHNQHHSL